MKIGDLVMCYSRSALIVRLEFHAPTDLYWVWIQYLDTGETAWAYEEELTLVTKGN